MFLKIRGILGKTYIHLIRICCVLKTLKTATRALIGVTDSNLNEITNKFANIVKEICQNINYREFIIDEQTAIRAITCIEYFNKHKLILSGYQFAPNSSFSEIFKVILSQMNIKTTATVFSPQIDFL
jgi:hypothetical protein